MVLFERFYESNNPTLTDRIEAVHSELWKTVPEQGTVFTQPLCAVISGLFGKLTAILVFMVLLGEIVIKTDMIRHATILDGENKVGVIANDGPWTARELDPFHIFGPTNLIKEQLVAHWFRSVELGLGRSKTCQQIHDC